MRCNRTKHSSEKRISTMAVAAVPCRRAGGMVF